MQTHTDIKILFFLIASSVILNIVLLICDICLFST